MKKLLLFLLFFVGILFLFSLSPVYAQKTITVNLSTQHLYAYDNGSLIYSFPVSTGKRATPTPTGAFWPWIKLRYDTMVGGSKARGDYYNLPNVPYVIYFYNSAYPKNYYYALHGTYWHNNFGHPMSHGCINLRTSDMAKLYYWVDLVSYDKAGRGAGTVIVVTGVTPSL